MYKIVIDSCGELFEEMKNNAHFANVPLTLEVGDWSTLDDATFDQAEFLKRVAEYDGVPKSACPSPSAYMAEMEDADRVYIITLSAQLSGSYNSAVLAKNLFEEEEEDTQIHVFDSKSASIGQTLIGKKIAELEEAGKSFEEVVEETEKYIEEQHTFFVLESLETLRKAGRLSNLKSMIANTLNIKPIMGSTEIGSIQQLAQARGMKKALEKMAECMMEVTKNPAEKVLAISHCNCPNTAEILKEIVSAKSAFREIVVVDTNGVSSMYANDGGIIMVV